MKNNQMCKIPIYFCSIFLFAQIAIANTGTPGNNLTVPVRYAKAPLCFKSYSSYLKYVSIKAFKGIDSANAFYKKELENATYTDYLPLTGGTLTGSLIGTDASFSSYISAQAVYISNASLVEGSTYFDIDVLGGKKLRLNNSGNPVVIPSSYIVIGTTGNHSNESLQVTGASYFNGAATFTSSVSGSAASFTIGTFSSYISATTGYFGNAALTDGATYFDIDVTGGRKLRLNNSGNPLIMGTNSYVLIGSTSNHTGEELQVTGTSYFNGTASFTGATFSGNVGIGTTTTLSEKFSVNGNIKAQKLIVTQTGWSDYVFNKDYKLKSLQNLEAYINQNKHLPEIPTAKEVEGKGISVGDNQVLLLKKIEELTLYLIDQNKRIEMLEKKFKEPEEINRYKLL